MGTNWTKRLMDLAKYVGKWSKDRSIGVGAVIADNDHRILSIGYNGFPAGCDDEVEERHQRPLKYKWTEHAERNAIYNAVRSGICLKGTNIYVMYHPCSDCARAIIQSGISKLYTPRPNFNDERWGEDFKVSNAILEESGVWVEYVEEEKS